MLPVVPTSLLSDLLSEETSSALRDAWGITEYNHLAHLRERHLSVLWPVAPAGGGGGGIVSAAEEAERNRLRGLCLDAWLWSHRIDAAVSHYLKTVIGVSRVDDLSRLAPATVHQLPLDPEAKKSLSAAVTKLATIPSPLAGRFPPAEADRATRNSMLLPGQETRCGCSYGRDLGLLAALCEVD